MSNAIKLAVDLDLVIKDFTNRVSIELERFTQHSKKQNYVILDKAKKC